MNFTRMMSLIAKELNKTSETQVDMALTMKMATQIELWSKMFQNKAFWLNRNVKSFRDCKAGHSGIEIRDIRKS